VLRFVISFLSFDHGEIRISIGDKAGGLLKYLSCFRSNLDEAIDKLQSVADLGNPSWGVKGNLFSFLFCFKRDRLLVFVYLCRKSW